MRIIATTIPFAINPPDRIIDMILHLKTNMIRINKYKSVFLGLVSVLFFTNATGQQPVPLRDQISPSSAQPPSLVEPIEVMPGTNPETIIQKYGKIIARYPLSIGGLTAWVVEKDNTRVLLYTTADSKALISGTIWNSHTGENLSDQIIFAQKELTKANRPKQTSSTKTTSSTAALNGSYNGDIPESIHTVAGLGGFKEGDKAIADTLYIIIDPRCAYCRQAYRNTRAYIKAGFSIKWIPVVALGNTDEGFALATTILQAQDSSTLERVLGNKENILTSPSQPARDTLIRNTEFMHAVFKHNPSDNPSGVPVAFYLDHRTGSATMTTGVSETVIIEDILGEL